MHTHTNKHAHTHTHTHTHTQTQTHTNTHTRCDTPPIRTPEAPLQVVHPYSSAPRPATLIAQSLPRTALQSHKNQIKSNIGRPPPPGHPEVRVRRQGALRDAQHHAATRVGGAVNAVAATERTTARVGPTLARSCRGGGGGGGRAARTSTSSTGRGRCTAAAPPSRTLRQCPSSATRGTARSLRARPTPAAACCTRTRPG